MKSPVTRQKYQKRLEKFFDFLNIEGSSVQEKSKIFVNLGKSNDNVWVFNSILKFMQFQLERANKRDNWFCCQKLFEKYKVILRNGRFPDCMEKDIKRSAESKKQYLHTFTRPMLIKIYFYLLLLRPHQRGSVA